MDWWFELILVAGFTLFLLVKALDSSFPWEGQKSLRRIWTCPNCPVWSWDRLKAKKHILEVHKEEVEPKESVEL